MSNDGIYAARDLRPFIMGFDVVIHLGKVHRYTSIVQRVYLSACIRVYFLCVCIAPMDYIPPVFFL
jgi:hypothetical protein